MMMDLSVNRPSSADRSRAIQRSCL